MSISYEDQIRLNRLDEKRINRLIVMVVLGYIVSAFIVGAWHYNHAEWCTPEGGKTVCWNEAGKVPVSALLGAIWPIYGSAKVALWVTQW